uniref:Mediator of RNA polymerase II transcription subunit 23 n=1 Tax=Cacopsylla melanoneura TaxID=428564 RepID=A0A8D8YA77_9HEMI
MFKMTTIEAQVSNHINDLLKVDYIEEAFSCYIVHKSNTQKDKLKASIAEFSSIFHGIPPETQELGIKQFLVLAGITTSHSRKAFLFNILEQLVADNVLPARLVCECILSSDKLQYKNEDFWIKSFQLVRKIIGGVDYKGVREIMKICCEKACSMPPVLTGCVAPQFKALENVIVYIFDRNACLLPSYFIVNELQKAYPEHRGWPHWKLSNLLSSCVASFRATAQMVSIIGLSEMLPVVEHSGYAETQINPWRLDPVTLKFSLKGNLPYDASLLKPQTKLLRYVLEQPYSRDMVCSLLGLQKTQKNRCVALEEQLVELLIVAMERSEAEACCPTTLPMDATSPPSHTLWLWLHLSSQLIYFVLFQFAKFPNIVQSLYEKLSVRDLRKGRDHLMWVLLQFISGSIQRNPLNNFLPVLKLYDLLYAEKEPLRVPDHNQPLCTHQMAMTCIWIHLIKKAQTDSQTQQPGGNVTLNSLQRSIPNTLKLHHEFLQQLAPPGINSQPTTPGMEADYRTALLCNAYSTNQDYFSRPMAALVETILGGQKSHQQAGSGSQAGGPGGWSNPALAHGPTVPLSMHILDALTVHAKMSLIHSIVTHVIKLAQQQLKANVSLAPALVETYSRLLVYTEIESLGIKGFISQLLPTVFKSHAWGILFTLLEMFSYRMHHIQPHYRVQLLSHLHSLAAVPQTNKTQLHLCVESTALRLITGLGSSEVQPQLSRFISEPKTLVSSESEELNRALVLTLARSMHIIGTGNDPISGSWCKDILMTIMQNTPHSWANHTLESFPPVLNEFFQQHSVPKENKLQLKKAVEEEYRNWSSMSNENDIIAHFSAANTPPLFLCLLWQMILETDRINPIVYKILEKIGARALSAHLRKFCDYLVFKFANSEEGKSRYLVSSWSTCLFSSGASAVPVLARLSSILFPVLF